MALWSDPEVWVTLKLCGSVLVNQLGKEEIKDWFCDTSSDARQTIKLTQFLHDTLEFWCRTSCILTIYSRVLIAPLQRLWNQNTSVVIKLKWKRVWRTISTPISWTKCAAASVLCLSNNFSLKVLFVLYFMFDFCCTSASETLKSGNQSYDASWHH